MYPRFLTTEVGSALLDTPVVLLTGARQTGKSTLVKQLSKQRTSGHMLTFDDLSTLNAAKSDPQGFISGLSGPVVIDEIQRVPEVLLPIKAAVDNNRQPGRYLLTGSANILLVPKLADSLAGRMEVITLRALSQGEIAGSVEQFLSRLFSVKNPDWESISSDRADLLRRLSIGGYPEVILRPAWKRRDAWFSSYVTTVLSRDVRDLSGIDTLTQLPRVLKAMASRTSKILNYADIARDLAMPITTLRGHVGLLSAAFLVLEIPAWSINIPKRLVKSSKVLITDSGLASHLLGLGAGSTQSGEGTQVTGALLETFVGNELLKQSSWNDQALSLFHFRTHVGEEVDYVLETPNGEICGVEVKFASTITSADVRGLKFLREAAGRRFRRGVILYTGSTVVPLDQQISAVPFGNLWA